MSACRRSKGAQGSPPDSMRGRFNGVFQMLTTLGMVFGQLVFGALGEIFPLRPLIFGAGLMCCVCVLIVYKGRKYVMPIYNREA